jgi:ABC-2 type transport system ATP-binding protein
MTPLGLFRFVAEVRGIPAARRRAAIDDAIDKVQLAEVLHQPIETLSKGFKRRVGLAQAILHDPEVLILDEPTDGLDPNQKHEVRNLIRSMSRDKVIILSTHILEEVDAVCSRAIIIARGRIVADGRPEELQARSRWHNAVTLTLRGAGAAKAPEKIAAVDGVSSIERREAGDGAVSFVAFSAGGRPIATKIGEATRALGVEVDEMRVEQGHLDEVFRALTTGDEAAPRAAAARSPKPAQAPGGNGASPSAAMSAPAASPKSSAATTAPGGGRKVGGTKSKSNKGGRR